MGNLYVIRHGQTTHNADHIIQGPRIDSELSDLGHRQAQAVAAAFDETKLDGVYVSPLVRARQTAEDLVDGQHGRVGGTVVPELYEMDYGRFCGQTVEAVQDDIAQIFDAWSLGFVDHAFPGGESPLLAQHRIRSFAHRLLQQAMEHDLAVVAHGRINRILLATLTGVPLRELARFPQDNANISHVEVAGGGAHVRRVNDIGHLDSLSQSFS